MTYFVFLIGLWLLFICLFSYLFVWLGSVRCWSLVHQWPVPYDAIRWWYTTEREKCMAQYLKQKIVILNRVHILWVVLLIQWRHFWHNKMDLVVFEVASLRHAQCSLPAAAFGTWDLLEQSGSRSEWLNKSIFEAYGILWLVIVFSYLVQLRLSIEVQRSPRGSNFWPPDHDRTCYVTDTYSNHLSISDFRQVWYNFLCILMKDAYLNKNITFSAYIPNTFLQPNPSQII